MNPKKPEEKSSGFFFARIKNKWAENQLISHYEIALHKMQVRSNSFNESGPVDRVSRPVTQPLAFP
jgi:hypothetical protein